MSILIDKEFESLIPPLSAEEFQQLEENCLRDGIRNASNRVYVAVDVDGEVQECIAKQMTIQGIDNEDLIEEQDREDLLTDLESRAI